MSLGQSWNVDLRAASAAELKLLVTGDSSVPDSVRRVVEAAIDALPAREDLGVMVATSGQLEDWAAYNAALADAQKANVPPPPKPSGFLSLWVGHTNAKIG